LRHYQVLVRRQRTTTGTVTELATWSGQADSRDEAQQAALAETDGLPWGPVTPADTDDIEVSPVEVDSIEVLGEAA